jgi:hypothetical protein
MIWTEEENDIRTLGNLKNPKGKNCMNCHWCNADNGDVFFTCGHHLENFSTNSFCGYWTSKNDLKVKAYFKKLREKLDSKFKK